MYRLIAMLLRIEREIILENISLIDYVVADGDILCHIEFEIFSVM